MKLLSTLLLFIFFQSSFAATYYISPNGNDGNGNGSMSSPWKTLGKATAAVSTPGDVIHVMAGTYIEATRSMLAVGVSIEGEGPSSIIQSTLAEEFVAIIIATSPEGTDGNQHISNIKLDGNKRMTSWAIEIRGRKNVSIHDCIISDFEDRGVVWSGQAANTNGAPSVYATGNLFYNNTLTNCAKYDGYGRGCLNIGGQEGMLIYNNKITQTGRAKGTNGWPIKFEAEGYLKGCKIYNNIITKEAYDGVSWDFAIELFNEWGLEIFKNTIIGAIDLNHQNKGDYSYGAYIHDNIIGPNNLQPNLEDGIILEFETNDVTIENNVLKNLGIIVSFTPREYDVINNVTFKNNLCENIGVADMSHKGGALRIGNDGKGLFLISHIFIVNNKFIGNSVQNPYWGIGILGASVANNILISKNTFNNFSAGYILANPAQAIDTIISKDNILSHNGYANKASFYNGRPLFYSAQNNTSKNASIFSLSNLKMNIIRPIYYEIISFNVVELTFILAIIAIALLSYKENVYIFPIGLITVLAYIIVSFEKEFFGQIILSLYYLSVIFYGWALWLKRNRKRHRIVRVTSYTKKEKLVYLLFTAFTFIGVTICFYYLKKIFNPNIIPWADAFLIATSFTAILLMAKKKVQNWHYWIACTSTAVPLFFFKHFLVYSLFFFLALVLSIVGLYKWKRRFIR